MSLRCKGVPVALSSDAVDEVLCPLAQEARVLQDGIAGRTEFEIPFVTLRDSRMFVVLPRSVLYLNTLQLKDKIKETVR